MKVNSSMTHYKKSINPTTRLEKWTKTVINEVMWQGGKGSSLKKGFENANDVKVFIPYSTTLPVFAIGDIIVKGTVTTAITSQSDLTGEVYNITSIMNRDYGSSLMHHIELGGK